MTISIGQPIRRKEDARLLTGQGQFSDDFSLPGQTHAVMVRSPYPHALIKSIDSEAAEAMPGVLGVFSGRDCLDDGLSAIDHSPIPSTKHDLKLRGPGDSDIFVGPHLLLPVDKARHVGEAVVMVVAETSAQASDGAEKVIIDFEQLPSVTDAGAALAAGAPVVWDQAPDNVSVDTSFGDAAATDAAIAAADHVVAMDFHIGRVTGVPLEPRAALANYDAETSRYVLYAGSGGAVRQKRELAAVLGVEPAAIRVIAADVGGNFGTRNRLYVEFGLVAWASKKLGRPVKYVCDRSEAFISDYQGRDLVTRVELALDGDGNFLALRADNLSNAGARIVSLSPLAKGSALVTGSYNIPVASVRSRSVFTNTVPTQAYRSSGRPEVTFAIERLVETAASELGFDPIELRRKNLVPVSSMPYTNPLGMIYDSGEYEANLDRVRELMDWNGFAERQAEAQSRGRLLGLGLAHYVESSTGSPREQAEISVNGDGYIDLIIGTQPSGQGHETSFAQVAADYLGVTAAEVNIIFGDTDVVQVGGGSHSGRSMRMAGTVIVLASEDLIEKGKKLAAAILEVGEGDMEFVDGVFNVAGTDRAIGLYQLAAKTTEIPGGGLSVLRDNEMQIPVFPNGCAVCEIEVDPETGGVQIIRYGTVDDVGRAINPMIVHGQTHGGIVQGVGQALMESCAIDEDTDQTLAGSLMDYGLPRADDVPAFVTEINEVPSPTNPLGVKAGGEGGTTPAPGVVINAIVDALKDYGIRDIPLPATPFTVWRAMRDAKA